MPSNSQRRGDRWERDLVRYLRAHGLPVARLMPEGRNDQGDLGGLADWALEAKDDASMSPSAMAAQADREAANAGKAFGVALRKTRGRGADGATAIMSMATWLRLLEYVAELERDK